MSVSVECPYCGQIVEPEATESEVATCPACQQHFTLPEQPATQEAEPEDERTLDAKRVRRLSAAKRSALRTRTYAVVGAGLAFAATLLLLGKFVAGYRAEGLGARQIAFLVIATATLGLTRYLGRVSLRLTRELGTSALQEPSSAPDFTPLDNGSQRWKNMEKIR